MARKSRKRIGQADGTASRTNRQVPAPASERQTKSKRYIILVISGLVVIAAVVAAGIVAQNESKSLSNAAPLNQPRAETLVAQSGTDSTIVSGGPQISFPETSHDFGTIAQGAKVTHTFIVRNTGDAPLRLIKAAGS